MKRLVALTTLFLVVAGCSSPENEAVNLARERWKPTQLGDSYYLCEVTAETNPPYGLPIRASKTLFEVRDLKLAASTRPLSEADKLNGIEWSGWVNLNAGAFRRYAPQPLNDRTEPDKTWSDWFSGKPSDVLTHGWMVGSMMVTKTKGKWKVEPVNGNGNGLAMLIGVGHFNFKQVEPSDLPK